MANTNTPFGLRPVRRNDGAAMSFQLVTRQIAYNNSHVMAKGDLVKSLTTGYIDAYVAGDGRTAGVFWGCEYPDPNNNNVTKWSNIWNAVSGLTSGQVVTAYIINDPQIIFEVQSNSTAITIANVQENADVVVNSANTTTGYSKTALDPSLATTSTLPLRIVGLGQGIGNGYDNTSSYNRVEVVLNNTDSNNRVGLA